MTQEPVVVLPGGRQVRCAFCRQDIRAIWDTPERQNEGHVGVRFHDNWRGTWRVTLDERDVTDNVVEALGGPNGWAILYVRDDADKRLLCSIGKDHGLAELVHGDVTLSCSQTHKPASRAGQSTDDPLDPEQKTDGT